MDELIKRSSAIDALDEIEAEVADGYGYQYAKWREYFAKMPTVDAVPVVHGRWIYGEDEFGLDGYHCNKCGIFVPWDFVHKSIDFIKDYHFCPHCMAKMDGKDKEHD